MELRVGGKFQVIKKIGSGSFGEIFHGISHTLPKCDYLWFWLGLQTQTEEEVAIKLVKSSSLPKRTQFPNNRRKTLRWRILSFYTNLRSIEFYKGEVITTSWMQLTTLPKTVGIPNLIWYGAERDYNVMVVDLLGPSLENLFTQCKRKFSVKTVLMLADQMVISSLSQQFINPYGLDFQSGIHAFEEFYS